MFNRIKQTYIYHANLLASIDMDEANPLNRISSIIPDGSTVLDVGAGNGLLANLLRHKHPRIIIDGIEPNEYACNLASQYYRNLYTGFAQDYFHLINNDNYDYIVLADVIEHMADPLTFLRDLGQHIGTKTKVLLSTPNVAFGAVRIALMNGEFRYVDSGLLERTHLRFFTFDTLVELVNRSGFDIFESQFLFRNTLTSEIHIRPSFSNFLYLLSIASDNLAHTYQFLLVLGKNNLEVPLGEVRTFGKKPSMVMIFLRAIWRRVRNEINNE